MEIDSYNGYKLVAVEHLWNRHRPWQPMQEAQALASELRCHIMSLGQNVVASICLNKDKTSAIFFFLGVPPNSDEYLIFLFRFVKVLGRTVDIDNDKSKKKCQQTPTLSRMATAVMAS